MFVSKMEANLTHQDGKPELAAYFTQCYIFLFPNPKHEQFLPQEKNVTRPLNYLGQIFV